MGSHHAGPEYPADQYPQDEPRYRRSRREEREQREQSSRPDPYGAAPYGPPPADPYRGAQQPGQAPGYGRTGGYPQQAPPTPGQPAAPAPQAQPERQRRYGDEGGGQAYRTGEWQQQAPAAPAAAAGPGPAPAPGGSPAAAPRPRSGDGDGQWGEAFDGGEPVGPTSWGSDEGTKVFSQLGYVPREQRRRAAPTPEESFMSGGGDADDKKFKSMRRARKSSPLVKIGVGAAVLVVLAAGAAGVWMLTGGEEEPDGATGGKYGVLAEPCAVLDTAAVTDLASTEDTNRRRETSETKSDGGAEQTCAIALTGENGKGVDVEFDSRVYGTAAQARNEWEFNLEQQQAEADGNGWTLTEVSGVGEGAYSLLRAWDQDAGTADYRLHLWDDNVAMQATLVIYSDEAVDDGDIAGRADQLVKAYLEKWAGQ